LVGLNSELGKSIRKSWEHLLNNELNVVSGRPEKRGEKFELNIFLDGELPGRRRPQTLLIIGGCWKGSKHPNIKLTETYNSVTGVG
jgi:hypothetical protein